MKDEVLHKNIRLVRSRINTDDGEWTMFRMAEATGLTIELRDCEVMLIGDVLVIEAKQAPPDVRLGEVEKRLDRLTRRVALLDRTKASGLRYKK